MAFGESSFQTQRGQLLERDMAVSGQQATGRTRAFVLKGDFGTIFQQPLQSLNLKEFKEACKNPYYKMTI